MRLNGDSGTPQWGGDSAVFRVLVATAVTLLVAVCGCNAGDSGAKPPAAGGVQPVGLMASPPTTVPATVPATVPTTVPATIPATVPTTARIAALPTTVPTTGPLFDANGFPLDTDPRDTIRFLAGDELRGRLPGTPGLVRAGDFLASELARLNVKPLPGKDGYFQPFVMTQSVAVDPVTRLDLNDKPLRIKTDFDPMGVSAEGNFKGAVAFVGYGITRPDYDDYAGIDVRGKVVLAMMKEPLNEHHRSRFAGPKDQWSASALFTSKAHQAKAHGAVALLLVAPPASGGGDHPMGFMGPDETPDDSVPTIQITRRVADLLLATANKPDLKTLETTIAAGPRPDSMDLPDVSVDGDVTVKRTTADVRNVMGYIPGVGPHADEWVVVGAHYDHLGNGQLGHMMGGKVGSLWHGADDNASGTAMVLEMADRAAHGPPPARSVLFVWFTGEEEGLIGSAYFTAHPPIPLDHVSSMLNLDMVGRLKGDDLLIGGGGTAADWDKIVAAAVTGTGLKTGVAIPDEGGRGGIGPSDHASFAMHRIPVLFLFTGLHADYHRPSDTADKINYAGMDRILPVAEKILAAMETMPRPVYDGTSDSGGAAAVLGVQHRATLGVMPGDPSTDPPGISIQSVMAGSPAEKAGIRNGDVITAIGTKAVASLSDLSEALSICKPGDVVAVKLVREGKPVTVSATMDERK